MNKIEFSQQLLISTSIPNFNEIHYEISEIKHVDRGKDLNIRRSLYTMNSWELLAVFGVNFRVLTPYAHRLIADAAYLVSKLLYTHLFM
jgi:hypothetical protein